jgi:hypothetical protein
MNNMEIKPTAVEWLVHEIIRNDFNVGQKMFEQAKKMEREQIKGSWLSAWKDSMLNPLSDDCYEDLAEAYYKETYGK